MHRKVGTCLLVSAVSLVFASSAAAASFDAHGSMEQVNATGLPAGAQVELLDSSDQVIRTGTANHLGGILFRDVDPGSGYKVRRVTPSVETSDPLTVLTTDPAPPDTSIYNQSIPTAVSYTHLTLPTILRV